MSKKHKGKHNGRRIDFKQDHQNIVKLTDALNRSDSKRKLMKLKIQSDCLHRDEQGQPYVDGKMVNGKKVWTCKQCGRQIRLETMGDEEVDRVMFDTISMIDVIKIFATADDLEVVEEMKKLAYEVQTKIPNTYRAAVKLANRQRNSSSNGGRRDQNSAGGWEPTAINR